jgi:hypothetical protein
MARMLAPLASCVCVWNRTFSGLNDLLPWASQDARHDMNPISAADVVLTVAIMTAAFLTEIARFILLGTI